MSDVITLQGKRREPKKQPDRYFLLCSKCKVLSFNVIAYETDDEEPSSQNQLFCAGCDSEVTSPHTESGRFLWAGDLPEVPSKAMQEINGDIPTIAGAVNTVSTGSHEFARRSVVRHVEQWSKNDTLALVIAFDTEAASKSWMDFQTEEQRQWVLRRIKDLQTTVEEWKLVNPVQGNADDGTPPS